MEVTFPRQKHRNRTSAKVIWLIIALQPLYYYLYKITEQFVDFQFTFLFMHIIPNPNFQTRLPTNPSVNFLILPAKYGPNPIICSRDSMSYVKNLLNWPNYWRVQIIGFEEFKLFYHSYLALNLFYHSLGFPKAILILTIRPHAP